MAEFQDVMHQWTRMCNSVPGKKERLSFCSDKKTGYVCPMNDYGLCNKSILNQTDDDILTGERIIMSWAAEHPEPVYETWLEFIKRFETGVSKSDEDFIYWMGATSIPADIAQKMGIKPKKE